MDGTMGELGAEGVMMALEDSMQAAQMAREIKRLDGIIEKREKEIESIKIKLARIMHENAEKDAEIDELRRVCRRYRAERAEGYARALDAARERGDKTNRLFVRLLVMCVVSVMAAVVMTAVMCLG